MKEKKHNLSVRMQQKTYDVLLQIQEEISLPLYGYKPSLNQVICIAIEEFYLRMENENESYDQ